MRICTNCAVAKLLTLLRKHANKAPARRELLRANGVSIKRGLSVSPTPSLDDEATDTGESKARQPQGSGKRRIECSDADETNDEVDAVDEA